MIFNIHTFAWILYNYTYKLWTYQYYHHLTPVVIFYERKISNFIPFYSIVTFILSYYTIYYLIIIQYHCHVGFSISSVVYKNTAISLRDNRRYSSTLTNRLIFRIGHRSARFSFENRSRIFNDHLS